MKREDDFELDMGGVSVSRTDDGTTLITSYDQLEKEDLRVLAESVVRYGDGGARQANVFATENTATSDLTIERVNELATGINSSLANVLEANRYILRNVVADGILGRAFECVTSNINTRYRLSYPTDREDIDEGKLEEVKKLIESFNEEINLKHLIREAASIAYLEGNYVMYLSLTEDNGAVVSHYALPLAYPSQYKVNGNPIVEFSVKDLKTLLKKTYPKNKKKKSIYYDDMEKEVKDCFPKEVYDAYRAGDDLAKLDDKYTGCILVGDNGRRFGVSPFFRCLKPLIVLTNIEAADVASSKARAKKIIFQKLRKELLGPDGTRKGLHEQSYAHDSAANALNSGKTSFKLYTAPAFVESLEYVVDDTKTSDPDLLSQYNSKLFTALGIGFADTNVANYSVANISIDQMLRTINSITEQLETVLERFYKTVLESQGYEKIYAPKISIVDSEQLSADLRKDIASFVYSQLNGSLETALEYMNIDIDDETERRKKENENGISEVFYPRQTSYTVTKDGSDGGDAGRPADSDDEGKQKSDSDYNDKAR